MAMNYRSVLCNIFILPRAKTFSRRGEEKEGIKKCVCLCVCVCACVCVRRGGGIIIPWDDIRPRSESIGFIIRTVLENY